MCSTVRTQRLYSICPLLLLVPWERCGRYLRSAEQKTWSRIWGGSGYRYTHVHRQGLPACQRVVWWVFYCCLIIYRIAPDVQEIFLIVYRQVFLIVLELIVVYRLHCWPAFQHRRPGLPAVRVRPLADHARRSIWASQPACTSCGRGKKA